MPPFIRRDRIDTVFTQLRSHEANKKVFRVYLHIVIVLNLKMFSKYGPVSSFHPSDKYIQTSYDPNLIMSVSVY